MEFEEQNQFKKEVEEAVQKAETLKDQLELKRLAYDRLNSRLRSRKYGYKTLLKELVKLEQKGYEEETSDERHALCVNVFEVQCEFDIFVKEYVRVLEILKETEKEEHEILEQLLKQR